MHSGQDIGLAMERLEERMLLSGALPNAAAAGMAYDAGGVLHVAFYDSVEMDLKYATRAADGTWSPVTTIDAAQGTGAQLSLALDSQGLPGVAYYDAAHKDLKYAHYDGATWSVRRVDAQGRVGRNPSLAFAANDLPLISYFANTGLDLRLASFNGHRWHTSTIDAKGNVGRFSSLAINPVDGTWAIAYESSGRHQVKFAMRRRHTFNVGVVDTLDDANEWSSKPSLAFDTSNRPAISYGDPAGDAVLLARISHKHWNPGAAVSGGNIGTDNTLSFDPQTGLPRIVYTDLDGGVNLASYDGSAWDAAGLGDGICAAAAENPITHTFSFLSTEDAGDVDPALAAPSDLTATAASTTEVDLSWTDNTAGANAFVVQRAAAGGAFSTVATPAAGVTDFEDDTVVEGVSYTYRVCATGTAANSVFSAGAPVTVPPEAPDGITATLGATGANISWTDHSDHESGFVVERSPDGNTFTPLATLGPDVTAYVDSTAAELTQYTYRVHAFTSATDSTATDNVVVSAGLYAPSVVEAAATSSSHILIQWTDNTAHETGYEITQSTDGVDFSAGFYTAAANATQLDVGYLTPGTDYWFRVRAVGDTVNSEYVVVQATTDDGSNLGAPTDVTAMISLDNLEWMNVHWSDNSSAETGFRIERSTDGIDFSPIDAVPANTTYYDDAGVAPDGTYYYRVVPFDNNGNGTPSAVGSGMARVAGPIDTKAVVVNAGRVDLSWTNVSMTADRINVYCLLTPDGSDILNVASNLDPTTTSFSVTQLQDGTPLTAGVSYAFWVSAARDDDGTFTESPSATVTLGFATPIDLFINNVTQDHMHVTWSDVLGETGYELQWSTNGTTFATVATVGPDITEYSLDGLTEGVKYYFRVRALSGGGNSAYSQVSNSLTSLATPTSVVATPLPGGQFQIDWQDNSAVESDYVVEVAGPSGIWSTPIVLPAGTTTYVAADGPYGAFVPGLQYRFSIRALILNSGGASDRGISGVVTALAQPN